MNWAKPWESRYCLHRYLLLVYCMDQILTFSTLAQHNLLGGAPPRPWPWTEAEHWVKPESWMAQAKRKGLYCSTGRWLSSDTPALLGISRSHGTCPQLLKEPDLWQRPMISAVINDTVKLINPSLCPQEKKTLWCQYCCLLVLDQAPQTQTFSGDTGTPLTDDSNMSAPIKPPPFVNKPSHGNIPFDNMSSEFTALQNLAFF